MPVITELVTVTRGSLGKTVLGGTALTIVLGTVCVTMESVFAMLASYPWIALSSAVPRIVATAAIVSTGHVFASLVSRGLIVRSPNV